MRMRLRKDNVGERKTGLPRPLTVAAKMHSILGTYRAAISPLCVSEPPRKALWHTDHTAATPLVHATIDRVGNGAIVQAQP
jgi:hypothetical protein